MDKLFNEKNECCGCSACQSVCPVGAIEMVEDQYGFLFPVVDDSKCINCRKCKKVCPMTNVEGKEIDSAYAVVLDDAAIDNSASGGAFYAVAKAFINHGGHVFGCAFDENLKPIHIEVSTLSELKLLQGSKYVQSEMECYHRIKELLENNIRVLFSGTPCQVAAIKRYIGNGSKYLFCVEIVCHGVPNRRLWKEYIEYLGRVKHGTVKRFEFRAKGIGRKFYSRYVIEKRNAEKIVILPSTLSSYYYNFLQGKTYRHSCYSCPFANEKRQADITICDYWGYDGIKFKGKQDISAVMIQGEKGIELFENAKHFLEIEESTFYDVAKNNEQLRKPSNINRYDESLFIKWKKSGISGIERIHRRKHWKAYIMNKLGLL